MNICAQSGCWRELSLFSSQPAMRHFIRAGFLIFLVAILGACAGDNNDNKEQAGPSPVFSASIVSPNSDVSIAVGESVNFVGAAHNAKNPNNLEYAWDFGDSNTSSALAPGNHTYTVAGTFSVSFSVTDTVSNASVSATPRTITVNAASTPSLAATILTPSSNQTISLGELVNFSAQVTNTDSSHSYQYLWDFGDGSTSAVLNPGNHEYLSTGNYTVNFSVTDTSTNNVASAQARLISVTPVVTPLPLTATIVTPASDQSITAGGTINFSGSVANAVNPNSLTYAWDFGDGQGSTLLSPGNHTYATAGNFTVTFSVTDTLAGVSASATSRNISVSALPPLTATIVTPASDQSITVGGTINFSGSVANAVNPNSLTYAWDFGDGQASTLLSPGNHTYATAGNFTVTFSVTDTLAGVSASATGRNITVTAIANEKIITFVELNDLHANLIAHTDIQRNADGTTSYVTRGGVARIATMMKSIKQDNPNNVIMNIGDTFHGGVEAFYSSGNDIVDVINMLPIDVGVPGNWDYIYGPLITRQRFGHPTGSISILPVGAIKDIHAPTYINLAANLTFTQVCGPGGRICSNDGASIGATWLKTIDGVVIGFIGITSDIVAKMHTVLATGMIFTQGEADYKTLINTQANALRNPTNGNPAADIVVVMSELGIHKDHRLADIINSNAVDIFFSAHTHELVTTPLTSNSGAIVVEAGNDTYLGRMDVHWDPANAKITAANWQVLPVETTIAEDAAMASKVAAVRAPYLNASAAAPLTDPSVYPSGQTLTMPITSVLTTSDRVIARHQSLENSFNNVITDLMRNAYGTDIAMTPGFRFDTVLEGQPTIAKDIRLEDVYRFVPVAYSVATSTVSGQQLKMVMEQNLAAVYSTTIFNQAGGWLNGFSGLTINLNLTNNDGNRVTSLALKGSGAMIDLTNTTNSLSITGCVRPFDSASNTLCSYGGFGAVTDQGKTMIDFLTEQLQSGNLSAFGERHDVHDGSGTLLWPSGEYYQPINGVAP